MVLKLDARFAIVWRDPFSLQIGVDPARVVLRDVTVADERMIAALHSGVSRSGLDMIAASSGVTEREVGSLLRMLKPVMLAEAVRSPVARVSIVGRGQTVERIAESLALAGVAVSVRAESVRAESVLAAPVLAAPGSSSSMHETADLGIVVSHYVLDPDSYGYWLRRDLPHLPVIFGDDAVTIGPLVEPGTTPCLYCLEYYRREADASWSAMAAQLWGRRSSAETALASSETATRVTRLVLARLQSGRVRGRTMAARSFRLAVDTGDVTRRDWMPHPECGCVGIPDASVPGIDGVISEGRPETGSAPGSDQPTTAAVSASLA